MHLCIASGIDESHSGGRWLEALDRSGALEDTDAEELAAAFKALADPVRLRLLSLIAAAPEGTACSCDLEEPVGKSQPTVSHHLSLLADAGLITKEKVGRWVNCTVVPERLAQLRAVLGA